MWGCDSGKSSPIMSIDMELSLHVSKTILMRLLDPITYQCFPSVRALQHCK